MRGDFIKIIQRELHKQLKVDYSILGKFYNTMAKYCNHEIVRAVETHPKEVPWKTDIEICGCGPSVVVQDIYDRALTPMLLHYHPIHAGPSTKLVLLNQKL